MGISLKENYLNSLIDDCIYYDEGIIESDEKLLDLDENSDLRKELSERVSNFERKFWETEEKIRKLEEIDFTNANWRVFLMPVIAGEGEPIHLSLEKKGSWLKAIRNAEKAFAGSEGYEKGQTYSECCLEVETRKGFVEIPEAFYEKYRVSKAPGK